MCKAEPTELAEAMENLLEVSDQEVKICFELNAKCRATVNLRSLIDGVPVAYKVQTSSPQKFLVNPPSGLIAPPLTNAAFQIILKPQSHLPPTFPRSPSDRFLIRAALAPEFVHDTVESSTSSSTITAWFSSKPHQPTHDLKLKVAFIGPLLLRHAVAAGEIDSVKSLLRRQRSIASDISPTEADSILRIAISSNNDFMIRLLVESGLRTTNTTTSFSPKIQIPKIEPLEASKSTRKNEHFNNDESGEALLESARLGDLSKLKWLVTNGAPLTFSDKYGLPALHVAAIKGRSDVVVVLLDCGCDAEWRDAEGHTALHLAVEGGNVDTVGILVRNGANVNAVSDRGATPLYMAQALGYDDIVQVLTNIGASIEAGSSPL